MRNPELTNSLMRTSGLNFQGLSLSSVIVGHHVNKSISASPQFNGAQSADDFWDQNLRLNVRKELTAYSRYEPIDIEGGLEAARRIYLERVNLLSRPLNVFFEIAVVGQYRAALAMHEDMKEHHVDTAFYHMMDVVYANQKEISAILVGSAMSKSMSASVNMLTSKIYDTFVRAMPATQMDLLNNYLTVIKTIVTDMMSHLKTCSDYRRISIVDNHRLFMHMSEMTAGHQESPMEEIPVEEQDRVTNGNIKAITNAYYDKQIFDLVKEDPSLKDDKIAEESDLESMDLESIDGDALFGLFDKEAFYIAEKMQRIEDILYNGVNRADAVNVLGLHPIKNRTELSKFPLDRTPEYIGEVHMGIIGDAAKLTKRFIRTILKIIETSINIGLKGISKVIGLDLEFKVSDPDKALIDWGEHFNSALDDFIEDAGKEVSNPEIFHDVVMGIYSEVTTIVSQLTEVNKSFRNYADTGNIPMMMRDTRTMGMTFARASEGITNHVIRSGILNKVIEPETFEHFASYDEDKGYWKAKLSTSEAHEHVKALNDELNRLEKSTVKARHVDRGLVERVLNTMPKESEVDDVRENIYKTIRDLRAVNHDLSVTKDGFRDGKVSVDDFNIEVENAVTVHSGIYRHGYTIIRDAIGIINSYNQLFLTVHRRTQTMRVQAKEIIEF